MSFGGVCSVLSSGMVCLQSVASQTYTDRNKSNISRSRIMAQFVPSIMILPHYS